MYTAGAIRWVKELLEEGLVPQSESYIEQLDHAYQNMHLLSKASSRKTACTYKRYLCVLVTQVRLLIVYFQSAYTQINRDTAAYIYSCVYMCWWVLQKNGPQTGTTLWLQHGIVETWLTTGGPGSSAVVLWTMVRHSKERQPNYSSAYTFLVKGSSCSEMDSLSNTLVKM